MQDAYNWMRSVLATKVPIDPDNVIVFGQSAGGGLSVISGYKLAPPPKAVISFYPYCTTFMTYYTYNPTTPLDPSLYEEAQAFFTPVITEYDASKTNPRETLFSHALQQQKAGWLLTTQDPNATSSQILATLSQYSAVLHVTPKYPPTYLAHGLNDTLVPYNQSVAMSNALNLMKVPNKLVLVPGVGHGFDNRVTPQQWQEYVLPAFDFAQQYLTTKDTEEINI